jgi:hypothetical protein
LAAAAAERTLEDSSFCVEIIYEVGMLHIGVCLSLETIMSNKCKFLYSNNGTIADDQLRDEATREQKEREQNSINS